MDRIAAMSVAARRLAKWLLPLLLPALTVVVAEYDRANRGPFFFGLNQDPSYSYLLGSLRLATEGETAFFHHPGLATQGIGAAVLTVVHATAGRDELARDVLARPELYLRAIQLTFLAAVASALAAVGFLALRQGDAVAALLLQTAPFLGALSLKALSDVSPESTLIAAALALSLAVWRFVTVPAGDERAFAIAFGAIAACAFTTRVSALPFVLIPPLLLCSWRGRFFFAGTAAAGSGLALLLIGDRWRQFLGWLISQGRRTGGYESTQGNILDLNLYLEGLAALFRRHHAFFAVIGLGVAVWLWHRLRQRSPASELFRRALGAVLIGQAAQVLLVSKNPAARYLVPATALAALDLALVWVLMTGGTGRTRDRRWPAVAALLLVIPVALELPRHRVELNRLRRGVASQRAIAAELSRLPTGCRVVEFARASSLPYALHFGQWPQPGVFAGVLAELYPQELFYEHFGRAFEDYAQRVPVAEVARKHSCLILHGKFRSDLAHLVILRTYMEILYDLPLHRMAVDPEDTRLGDLDM